MIAYCNDCKKETTFKINENQDSFYIDNKRQKECIECGRYEPREEIFNCHELYKRHNASIERKKK